MLFTITHELSTILFISVMVSCLKGDTKYYEIENSEKKTEYENPTDPNLPEAESYVIGVKRALLPFRQLSKYLRRPVNDPRSANSLAGNQWKLSQQSEGFAASSEIVAKTQNRKRWDKGDTDSDKDPNCPEIILIRPINISKVSNSKFNREVNEGIKTRQMQDSNFKMDSSKIHARKQGTSTTPASKRLKIDNQIFQGNGLNIKLTFSVDVGNQSKAILNGTTNGLTTSKPLKKGIMNRSRQ